MEIQEQKNMGEKKKDMRRKRLIKMKRQTGKRGRERRRERKRKKIVRWLVRKILTDMEQLAAIGNRTCYEQIFTETSVCSLMELR